MAQWLRAVATLLESLGLIHSMHVAAHTHMYLKSYDI